jgi:hypothetical protein
MENHFSGNGERGNSAGKCGKKGCGHGCGGSSSSGSSSRRPTDDEC